MEHEKLLSKDKITSSCQTYVSQAFISNVTGKENELWKTYRLTSYQKPRFLKIVHPFLCLYFLYDLYGFFSRFEQLVCFTEFGSSSLYLDFDQFRVTATLNKATFRAKEAYYNNC